MDMNLPVVRALVALALGLAALAGLDVVMRAIGVPDWLPRFVVLAGFVIVIAVTLAPVLVRTRSKGTARE
jgi:hypothetical protein